jgi:hypothetical protein
LTFNLYSNTSEIPAEQWAQVVPESELILSIPYLQSLESKPSTNMRFCYALLYNKQGQPAAAAVFQLINFKVKGLGPRIEKGLKLLGIYSESRPVKILVCGNAFFSGEYGFHYNTARIQPTEAFAGLNQVIQAIVNNKADYGRIAFVMAKDFGLRQKAAAMALEKFGFRPFTVDPCMDLVVSAHWHTFDDYIAEIVSKYKKRWRAIHKKLEPITVKELNADEIRESLPRLTELMDAVQGKARFMLAKINPHYLPELKSALGEKYLLKAYYKDELMIGFASSVIMENQLEAHFIGVDYAHNHEYELYQNLLYDYVQQAITFRIPLINFGRTALEIKSNLGAVPVPVMVYIKHTNPILNLIIRPFLKMIEQTQWTQRFPFRN